MTLKISVTNPFFGCRAEPPYGSQGGAETPSMHFKASCVRSSEETRGSFNVFVINESLL